MLEGCGFMALELIRNFKRLKRIYVLGSLVVIILLCGCDAKFGNYPYDKASCWSCTEPEFTIEYSTNESGVLIDAAVVNWNNEEISVDVDFQSSLFWVLPANSDNYDDRLLSGSWQYQNDDLVLFIDEDFLFEGQYSELVFSPIHSD